MSPFLEWKVYLLSVVAAGTSVVASSISSFIIAAVSSVILVLDFLESSDSLSGNVASSVASPSSSSRVEGGVDLGVQLAEVILGEDVDVLGLGDLSVALVASSTVGSDDLGSPLLDLGDVSVVLSVTFGEGGVGESLE